MTYAVYQNARNASWQCLLDCHISQLPVKPIQLAAQYGICCKTASLQWLTGASGTIKAVNGEVFIVFREDDSRERQRFTIMHELGHYLLGHLGDTPLSRNESECRPEEEQAADHFAIGVLAPACVLWGLGLNVAEDIAKICGVSIQAAQIRAERMKLLRQRDMFLSHPLERRVYKQFEQFVKQNRSHNLSGQGG